MRCVSAPSCAFPSVPNSCGDNVNKRRLGCIAIALLAGSSPAVAGDGGHGPAVGGAPYNWNGFYAGVTAAAAWGQYGATTSTVSGGYMDTVEATAVNTAGIQSIKTSGFGAGIEGGYNWQTGHLLLGFETDLQALHLNGATNSGAVAYPDAPVFAFTASSAGSADWLFTARPRIGFVTANNWLFYVTGGLALTRLQTNFSFIDSFVAQESGSVDALKLGAVAGGGIEAPLTDRLSVKVDYLHVAFGNTAGASTANNLTPVFPAQVFSHSSNLQVDIVRAGLNYRFGGFDVGGQAPILPFKAPNSAAPPATFSEWEVQTGVRSWLSNGTIGVPNPLLNSPPLTLASRIEGSDLQTPSGEAFARVDHASGFFAKGYLGAAGIARGQLRDEDFPGANAYSNTLSTAAGHLGYATVDLGYDFLRTPTARLGGFVGYNYYDQTLNASGCAQQAGDTGICAPAFPSGLLALTESDSLNSLRIGVAVEARLTDRVSVSADAAYVPWVNFAGLDDHLLRQLILTEASNSGDGIMLEAAVDYWLTSTWSIGVGARYWAWNLNTGTASFNFLAAPAVNLVEPARFNIERYGVFVQSSYRWGATSAAEAPVAVKAPTTTAAMDWSGVYVGGQLGGGISSAAWSDPFATAPSGFGGTDIAGFGDSTRATGPLGGGQIGVNWQIGHMVAGATVDADAADMRGEATCFSGLGGIECRHNVSALALLTGRVGYAWDRSLVYVKAAAPLSIRLTISMAIRPARRWGPAAQRSVHGAGRPAAASNTR